MPSIKLTRRTLASLAAAPDRDLLYWDTALPGFGVRITRGGVRSYVVQFRAPEGRSRRVTVGGCDTFVPRR